MKHDFRPLRRSAYTGIAMSVLLLSGCDQVKKYSFPSSLFVAAEENEHQQFGGTPIRRKEYGWFTAIRRAVGNSFECSGFLIGRRYVVTANHCVKDESTHKVQVGYLCQKFDNCGRASQIVGIRKVHRHEGGGDMALLELQERVSKRIIPIVPDLGTGVVVPKKINKKQKMTMVGSGRTGTAAAISETVEKLRVTYLPRNKCAKKVSNKSLLTDFTICSTPPKNTSPCRGDSGSALVVPSSQDDGEEFSGRDVAIALHVFGPRDCSNPRKRFGGHFRLSAAADLIESVVCGRGPKHAEDWCTTAPVFFNDMISLVPPLKATLDRTLGFSEVYVLAYNEDGSRLVTGACPGIRIWDTRKGGAPLASITTGDRCVDYFMETSPDGFTVAAGIEANEILLIDSNSGEITKTLTNDDAWIRAVAWDTDGKRLVSLDWDGRIKLWDVPRGEEIDLDSNPTHEGAYAIFFGPNDAHVTTVSRGHDNEGEVIEWETTGFFLLQRYFTSWMKQPEWAKMSISPDKSLLATFSVDKDENHVVLIVDATTYDVTLVLEGHVTSIPSVAWSTDGRFVVSGDDVDTVIVWDVTTGKQVLMIAGKSQHVHALRWSPDGVHIAIGHHDDTVTLYELRSAKK